ncbi:MAG: PAS domain S-box protein [Lentisphaerae bacterium]|nr:PAS domain S-box protein [Lentisphaerota bacterium]
MIALRKHRPWTVWTAVLLAGWAVAAGLLAARADRVLRGDLLAQARLVANALDPARLLALSGTEADREIPDYRYLKNQLAAMIRTSPRIRYIYLLGRRADGTVFFFLDTGQHRLSEQEAAPGQPYGDMPGGFRPVLEAGTDAVFGPYADEWGTFVTAATPVTDPETGRRAAVLGLDVAAADWRRAVAAETALPSFLLLVMLAALGVAAAAWRQHRLALRRVREILEARDESRSLEVRSARRSVRKGLLFALALIPIGFIADYVLRHQVVLPGFRRLEERESARILSGCLDAIARESEQLGLMAVDWAHWDDTFAFVQDRNPDYEESNLEWPSLSNSGIDLIRIVDAAGGVVWQGIYDAEAETHIQLEEFPEAAPMAYPSLLALDDPAEARSGLVRTGAGPLLVASAAILTTQMQGPSPGYFILGRFLGGEALESIARQMGVAGLAVADPGADDLSDREREALAHLSPGGIRVEEIDDATLGGTALLAGVDGRPALLVSVELPRDLVRQGQGIARLLSAVLLLAVLGIGAGLLAWNLASTGELLRRQAHIEDLVERRTAALSESEGRLAATLRSIGDGVIVCDRDGRITSLNEVAETLTGWPSAEAAGRDIGEVFRIVDARTRAAATPPVERSLREGVVVGLANHTVLIGRDGTEYQIADSCAPIRDPSGAVLGAVLVFRDVTADYRRREELREAESRVRAVLEGLPEGILAADLETHGIVFANDTLCRMLGMTREEILGKTPADIHPAEAMPRIMDECGRMLRTETSVALDIPVLRKDGTALSADFKVSRIELDGRCCALAVFTDITVRKQAEEALRVERDLFAAGPVLTIVWDPGEGWPVRRVSSNVASILGYSAGEMTDPSFRYADLIHPDDAKRIGREVEGHIHRHEDVYEQSYRLRVKNGGFRWFYDFTKLVRDDQGAVREIHGYIFDQTQLKEYETTLVEQRRRLESIIDGTHAGTWEWNVQTGGIHVNARWAEMAGYALGDLAPVTAETVRGLAHPDDQAMADALLERHFAGDLDDFECEMRIRHKDGHWVWVLDRGKVSARTPDGCPLRMQGTRQDISRRKHAEEDQEALQAKLNQAQKMEAIGQLAGGVAHDFNNMLGVILGFTELSLEGVSPDQPLHASLLEIRKAAERSADLTRQLLAFARKQTVAPRVLDFNATVESMLAMLRRLIGEHIELEWRPGPDIGRVRIDPSQVDQILVNLCVNVRDAIGEGGRLVIETASASFDEASSAGQVHLPGDYVRLTVADNGCGMDAVTAAHVFEPFFTTKEMSEGAGLGLATVYGIVRQNNGFIRFDTRPGEGTAFHIHLPRHADPGEAPAPPEAPAPRAAAGRETILLVEDDLSLLGMTRLLLEREGYAVHAAGTPEEALRIARETPGDIHLLVTDVIMPGMNGRDLARKLLEIRPGLRRLFMSGYTADVIAPHGVLNDGVHFIQKPFVGRDLLARIREALEDA